MPFLKGINYWSFPGSFEDKVDPFDAIRLAKEHGYEALEFCIGGAGTQVGLDISEQKVRDLVADAEEQGIALDTTASGLYWGNSLGDPDPAVRGVAKDQLKKMLEISSLFGAKVHLTIPGAVDVFFDPSRPVQNYSEVMKWGSEGLFELLPHAESCGVKMGIENVWNKILITSGEMKAFLEQFNSPWVGCLFDVGNVIPFGYPEQWIRHLREHIIAIHIKDYKRSVGTADGFVDLFEGDVDFAEVMNALEEIGFSGPLVAEMIPHYPRFPMVRVSNTSRAMDAFMGR
jgi:L-ribulose-5-phosphate 3-epimerase